MTLKEKFKKQLDTATPTLNRPFYQAEKCEAIAEEFACDILNWFKNQVFLHCEWSVFDLTEKEILEIYKKEKGL